MECQGSTLLERFIDDYVATRTDIKEASLIPYRHVKADLLGFFGSHRDLSRITVGDADDWHRWMKSRHASSTASRRLKYAKEFFSYVVFKTSPFGRCFRLYSCFLRRLSILRYTRKPAKTYPNSG